MIKESNDSYLSKMNGDGSIIEKMLDQEKLYSEKDLIKLFVMFHVRKKDKEKN